jgi:protease PrsW
VAELTLINELKFFATAILFGVLPTFVWLLFWLEEDRKRPEPKYMIARAFIVGGLSVVVAFMLQLLVRDFIGELVPLVHKFSVSLGSLVFVLVSLPTILIWAFIEEAVKLAAAYFFLFRNKHFDEPIDAMIYMITLALGFSAIENSLFLFGVWSGQGLGMDYAYFFMTGNLRFLGATVLHLVSSAVVGAAIALAFCGSIRKKILYAVIGLILATVLHALFNFFIIVNDSTNLIAVLISLWGGAILVIYLFERVKRIVCRPAFMKTFIKANLEKIYAKR